MRLWCCLQLLILFALGCGVDSQRPLPGSPLIDFQVSQPLLFPEVEHICSVSLIEHVFDNSFGRPAIVQYQPPVDCGAPGTWAAISLNFTGTSRGVQFDRLAQLYLSGVEIWRTSTPEPTADGILWTAMKDVSKYSPLFAQHGTLLLDLGNLLDDTLGLTAEYNVTLIAQFYASSANNPPAATADIILPLSSVNQAQGSAFMVPPAGDVIVPSLPRNIAKASVEIYASGNANEEFWYGNVPDSFFPRLPEWDAPDGLANPKGPFREVQLLIDGLLAGVVFPYPVIYSGEFLPSIWSPMLSYGAFDSPSYYIDITPFVPHLCDGNPHNFTLDVAGMGTNFSINANWIISGNIQLLLDMSGNVTTGGLSVHQGSRFVSPIVIGSVSGPAPNITVSTSVNRSIYIQGLLITGSGERTTAVWQQQLSYTNTQAYSTTLANVSMQHVAQISHGSSISHHNDIAVVSDTFAYPLSLNLSYFVIPSPASQTFFTYGVKLQHSYQREFLPASVLIGGLKTEINTIQRCEGMESKNESDVKIRTGTTNTYFDYQDDNHNTYIRDIQVTTYVNITTGLLRRSNSSLIYDHEGGTLAHRSH